MGSTKRVPWDANALWQTRLGTHGRRLLQVVWGRLRDDLLSLRAMSLTYATLLSFVPFLAVTFSLLKAFGIQNQIEPVLAQWLEPLGEQGVEITRRVIGFVDNLKVGVLGAVGLAALFYTVISLIGRIEDSLNQIWRVRTPRRIGQRFSDYLSVVLVGPVLVFSAFALTASAQSSWVVQRVLAIKQLGFVVVMATKIMPFIFLCAAFTFLYRFIPHTKVRLSSALLGGAVAAVLWQLAGAAFAGFVAGSGRYAAIYSSFAILILFLIWLYVGWLVVLVGAEVAYFHQHPYAYLQEASEERQSYGFRETLALLTLLEVTRQYLQARPPPWPASLARSLGVPLASLDEAIEDFVACGILVRTAEPEGVTLARPPEQIAVPDILERLRGMDALDYTALAGDPVAAILERRDACVRRELQAVTLKSLASETSDRRPEIGDRRGEITGPP